MSSIGMTEVICSHDEFSLVREEGVSGGAIYDVDGEFILRVGFNGMEVAEKALPLLTAMYRKAFDDGERAGRGRARHDIRKALGVAWPINQEQPQ